MDERRSNANLLQDAYLPLRLINKLDALEKWVEYCREIPVSPSIALMRKRIAEVACLLRDSNRRAATSGNEI